MYVASHLPYFRMFVVLVVSTGTFENKLLIILYFSSKKLPILSYSLDQKFNLILTELLLESKQKILMIYYITLP